MSKAPQSMDDFMQQATAFVQKGRDRGIDDNKLANTVKFMFQLTQQNISNNESNAITPYQEASLDIENRKLDIAGQGSINYNSDTGEYYNNTPGASSDVNTWMSPNANTTIDASTFGITPTLPPAFDFDSAADAFTYRPDQTSGANMTTNFGEEVNTRESREPWAYQPNPIEKIFNTFKQ